jgi:UrcA family protein
MGAQLKTLTQRRIVMETITTRGRSLNKVVFGMIAGCLLGALSVGTASAATADDVPSIVVKYDPSTLASEAGARALYQRLERVARHVCPEASGRDLKTFEAARSCERQAVARAVRDINSQRLAEVASSAHNG